MTWAGHLGLLGPCGPVGQGENNTRRVFGPPSPTHLLSSLSSSSLSFSFADPVVSGVAVGDSHRRGPPWPPPWCRKRLPTLLFPPVQLDLDMEPSYNQIDVVPNPRVWGWR